MIFEPLDIADVVLITPRVFGDERGFFMETFRQEAFEQHCGEFRFVQDNHSKSSHGILRGLHYQLMQPQGKLVRVTAGSVFDVVVDLRKSSNTFGRWVGVYLDANQHQQLWVPPGFAHGFYVTSDFAEFQYKCTDYYAPEDEHCLSWDDPEMGIGWPLVGGKAPVLSEKDANSKGFSESAYFD